MIYDASTSITPGNVIYTEPSLELPNMRYATPSGTFSQGDTLVGFFTLTDSSGNPKPLEFDGFKVVLKDWPEGNKEILAVMSVSFMESEKISFIPQV